MSVSESSELCGFKNEVAQRGQPLTQGPTARQECNLDWQSSHCHVPLCKRKQRPREGKEAQAHTHSRSRQSRKDPQRRSLSTNTSQVEKHPREVWGSEGLSVLPQVLPQDQCPALLSDPVSMAGPAVALKLLRRDSVLRTTFLREFCVGRCVSSHPGLLQTLGGPLQTPRHFAFAQEYAPYGDLSGMLQEKVRQASGAVCPRPHPSPSSVSSPDPKSVLSPGSP